MHRIKVILFLLVAAGCSKDEGPEKFTSMNGPWTVRTPDSQTTLSFNIAPNANNIPVINEVTLLHNGTEYDPKIIQSGIVSVPPNRIESLTFSHNSLEGPYILIRMITISINEDFTEMQIENSSFNINDESRLFQMIIAERQ